MRKNIFNQLNISAQCKKYGVPFKRCPQFIFLIMGIIIIAAMLITYGVGSQWINDPMIVALLVLVIVMVLLVLSFIITQSFDRLAEASRMKSEFINIISHQLRSPLTNLKWTIDFLMSETEHKSFNKETEYFTVLKKNCARMNELINDLLIISRLEQKKFEPKKQEVSLPEILKELVLKDKHFALASNIEIKLDIDKNLPKIFCDPSHIKIVVENLLDNAIRYSSVYTSGQAQGNRKSDNSEFNKSLIEIKLEQRNKDIYFEIKDQGIGIPKNDQKYIFEKFFRSKNILKHQIQGNGLGLNIVKSIIEKSKGKIGFVSEQDKGSTFWFTLPIT